MSELTIKEFCVRQVFLLHLFGNGQQIPLIERINTIALDPEYHDKVNAEMKRRGEEK